ncbi:DUF3800 domain-containing protein [Mesorhizobium sp. M0317]|uniref:DUF3800 domain-containing protein n=1 Tax=Mesorhizobium sp. M0317 TaxID=2956935 RepID=UPI00333D1E54
MIFAYLDEFGHVGPFYGCDHPNYNTSPVFGLAGILLPEQSVRSFATYFLKQKAHLLGGDIAASGKHAYEWEKKGTNLFTARSIEKYPEIRKTAFRIINQVRTNQGKIFYYGREKIRDRNDLNANGLYKTILSHALRQIDSYCAALKQNFVVVVDEHSARKELLEAATKTMFGSDPTRWLASPPFQVESYLNQNIQAADWIAAITGRLWNYRLDPAEFKKYEPYERFFWSRLHAAATHSTVMERPKTAKITKAIVVSEIIKTVTVETKTISLITPDGAD